MGAPDDFKALRNAWGDYANRHYALAGLSLRIDMRSYAARGIDMVPGRHLGPALSARRARGLSSETLAAFAQDDATREALLVANPEIAVDLTVAYPCHVYAGRPGEDHPHLRVLPGRVPVRAGGGRDVAAAGGSDRPWWP